MARIEAGTTIERPIEEVFAVVSDSSNRPRWVSGVSEFAKTSDRPIGVGTTWHGVGSFMGRKTESGAEYSQLEADRVFTLQATTPFPTSMAFASELVASGTRVDLTVEAEPTGLYRLAEPLLSTGWPGRFSSAVRAAVPERPRQAQGPDGHPRPLVGAPTAARR